MSFFPGQDPAAGDKFQCEALAQCFKGTRLFHGG